MIVEPQITLETAKKPPLITSWLKTRFDELSAVLAMNIRSLPELCSNLIAVKAVASPEWYDN
jgi:hypothetical protein